MVWYNNITYENEYIFGPNLVPEIPREGTTLFPEAYNGGQHYPEKRQDEGQH
jgi:hypothetical protein